MSRPAALIEVDPLHDERWTEITHRHPRASIFHTRMWLQALRATYEYEPVAFTKSAPGERLDNVLLFCRVRSWMTGRRLVSLPFSDHCDALVDDPATLTTMLQSLTQSVGREGRYIELRPIEGTSWPAGFRVSAQFCWHSIDLRPDLDTVFSRFHKSHTQRAIKKADRVGLTIAVDRSIEALEAFYALHTLTRRRHGVPVQPFAWFRNLGEAFTDRLRVYVARMAEQPVAAIVTLRHRQTLVYKYGCSDPRFNSTGATSALFWRAIRDAKAEDLREFDLGRSDMDDVGLQAFKDHLGGERQTISYYRYTSDTVSSWRRRLTPAVARTAQALVPKAIQVRAGSSLYKHFA
jgi:CelD/BcsL family acetyltransferase involved in cellulose biosynthesis